MKYVSRHAKHVGFLSYRGGGQLNTIGFRKDGKGVHLSRSTVRGEFHVKTCILRILGCGNVGSAYKQATRSLEDIYSTKGR